MASRQRIRKLSLGPSEPVTARNSCAGMIVIADYLDPINNHRTLVLERVGSIAANYPVKLDRKPRAKVENGTSGDPAKA